MTFTLRGGEGRTGAIDAARLERRILFFTCAAHALTHVYMVIYSVVLLQLSLDFAVPGLSPEENIERITRFATISTVLFGVGALPASWMGERWGEKSLLVAFFMLSALGGTLLGLARAPVQLAVGMAFLGLGTSIFHPVGNTFIAKGIRKPGRAMGVNGLWGSFGEALGPLMAGQVASWFSWRAAYLSLTVPTVALGLWLAFTRIDLAADPDARNGVSGQRFPATLMFLLLAMMCGGFQFWIVKTMLPIHFQGDHPDVVKGGYLTGAVYLIGGFGQLWAGRMVHDRDGRGLYAVVFLLSVPLLYLVGKLSGGFLMVVACVAAFLMFAAQPIENVLLSRYSSPRWRSSVFGLKFTLAFGIGGIGTLLSGWVQRKYDGTGATFTAAACFTGLAFLLAVLAYRSRKESGSEASEEATPISDP